MTDGKVLTYRVADRGLIRTAQVVSWVFTPFSIPFLAFLALFLFSYMRMMPMYYKMVVLSIVGCFTIVIPAVMIFLFKYINGLKMQELGERRKRYMPFLLTIMSYVCCLFMMRKLNIPWYMTGIILAALLVQLFCVLMNLKWKLSEHMAGAGSVVGGVVSFSALLGYNPLLLLCAFILISGVLGSARIVLRHHTLSEVLGGFLLGYVCSMLVLNPSSLLFRLFILL